MSPAPLNRYCANVLHIRAGTHVVEVEIAGLVVEVILCTECRQRLPQDVGGPVYEGEAIEVLGKCPHGVNLDTDFCPEGCRV